MSDRNRARPPDTPLNPPDAPIERKLRELAGERPALSAVRPRSARRAWTATAGIAFTQRGCVALAVKSSAGFPCHPGARTFSRTFSRTFFLGHRI